MLLDHTPSLLVASVPVFRNIIPAQDGKRTLVRIKVGLMRVEPVHANMLGAWQADGQGALRRAPQASSHKLLDASSPTAT